jgi:hypothetical protein
MFVSLVMSWTRTDSSSQFSITAAKAATVVYYMTRSEDGKYHIYPSFSPEQKPTLWCRDGHVAISLVGARILGND